CIVTGNPLRSNIEIEERAAARARLGLPEGFTVLSFGGSLGAPRITDSVAELIAWESKKGGINHIHSYGGKGKDMFYQALEQSGATEDKSRHIFRDYIDNMYTCICAADLVISRAGAMTVTELTAIGRPSILIPYPYATENHQYYNALTLSNANAAVLIEDEELTRARLIEEVSALYADRHRLTLMEENSKKMSKNNAADKIMSEIIDLLGNDVLSR
ncbi:MAG: undecaprenyldiphospho-muramoylpentapeptide beta-N-acetylglucosaminyltransferase, partial [Oscillospiraceae bacterium]|nr:undecaprenyldiphospho-muramoylpentapeptide beta-N-acetylglucosaminyltransferase [Oscillospiraceae bacterium]